MKYWFKRKTHGWGWTPSTWQGWLTVCAYVAIISLLSFSIDSTSSQNDINTKFILPMLIATVALLRISYIKGEKPKWQWGEGRKSDVSSPKSKIKARNTKPKSKVKKARKIK